jgi:hypothetical protein
MRILGWFGILFVCFVSGGATCARRDIALSFPPPPVVLNELPSLAEVTGAVNRTQRVRQLSSNSAKVEVLSMPSVPRLGATLNLERDRRFRLRASLPILLGAGIDLGSNDEMFWFEVPEGVSKKLYYARHDEYRRQLHRAVLPVDPTWVMDALGLVQIDPNTVIAGPVKRQDGKLEIRNSMSMPDGMYQRVCLIEPKAGYVTHQFLYSPAGAEIARSEASNHFYYDQPQCALPHRVELHLTPSVGPPLSMRIDVGTYAVNQLLSSDPALFAMPANASTAVDLTTLSGVPPTNAPAATSITTSSRPGASSPVNYRATAPAAYPLRGTLLR